MLKIHSSLTLSIAISDFLEEMDISESLKCSRKVSFQYFYLKSGTWIVYGEFFVLGKYITSFQLGLDF